MKRLFLFVIMLVLMTACVSTEEELPVSEVSDSTNAQSVMGLESYPKVQEQFTVTNVSSHKMVNSFGVDQHALYITYTVDNSISRIIDGAKESVPLITGIVDIVFVNDPWFVVLVRHGNDSALEVWNWPRDGTPNLHWEYKASSGESFPGKVVYLDDADALVFTQTCGGIKKAVISYHAKGTKAVLDTNDASAEFVGVQNGNLFVHSHWFDNDTLMSFAFSSLIGQNLTDLSKDQMADVQHNEIVRWGYNDLYLGDIQISLAKPIDGSPQFSDDFSIVAYPSGSGYITVLDRTNGNYEQIFVGNYDKMRIVDHTLYVLQDNELTVWEIKN